MKFYCRSELPGEVPQIRRRIFVLLSVVIFLPVVGEAMRLQNDISVTEHGPQTTLNLNARLREEINSEYKK